MKAIWFALALLLLQMPLARSAEYQGKTIDGRTFPAQVYSYATGGVYDAQVQFNRDRATVKFPEGGQFIVKLPHTVITDPAGIEAFGTPGRIPLGNSFSVGLSGVGISDNLFPNTPNPLTSFWKISIDLTVMV